MKYADHSYFSKKRMLMLGMSVLLACLISGCSVSYPLGSLSDIKYKARRSVYQDCIQRSLWQTPARLSLLEVIDDSCRKQAERQVGF